MKTSKNFHLISLGCSKNSVDSESMAQLLIKNGYQAANTPDQSELIIVNTCGFIGPAKEESYQVLNELAKSKQKGQLLIAAGCLSQRYGAEVVARVDGIDGVIGTRRWMDIMQLVQRLRARTHPEPLFHLPEAAKTVGSDEGSVLRASSFGTSAYLKIADGCRRPCAFCAIPAIKGTLVSRPIQSILHEAQLLQAQGVREIILIAQDSTDFGHDLGIKNGLAHLLRKLVEVVPETNWLRIMYSYPGYVTDELIEVMAEHPQILPYLDIPLQHADPRVLKQMRRPANIDWVYRTLEKMRKVIPDLALRTTFIVGYPAETEQSFQSLLDFVSEIRFDRVGAFTYSLEPGTSAEDLGDPVPEEIKLERYERLMALQQRISLEKNQQLVGKVIPVLIEGHGELEDSEEMISVGRSYRDAPEIDGMVFIDGHAPLGEILPVQIDGAMTYDLTGQVQSPTTDIFFKE